MGLKEEAVQEIGFSRLAIFRPGVIGGNVHTPGWVAVLGRFIPGSWGTVDQEAIGRAFVGGLERKEGSGTKFLSNADMRRVWASSLGGRMSFKSRNDFRAHYARLIMAQEPDLFGVFEIRELRSGYTGPA